MHPIVIKSKWCNNNNEIVDINSVNINLAGPASGARFSQMSFTVESKKGALQQGECEEYILETKINDCASHFNYAVDIKGIKVTSSDNPKRCDGYTFEAAMKRRCKLKTSISCSVLDGNSEGTNIPCAEFQPCGMCNGDGKDYRSVVYDFSYVNMNNRPLRLDVTPSKFSKAKVDGKIVSSKSQSFQYNNGDIPPWETSTYSKHSFSCSTHFKLHFLHISHECYCYFLFDTVSFFVIKALDVCNYPIPKGAMNLLGELVDRETNEVDEDFQFCFDYTQVEKSNSPECNKM